jgi:hypothetical protein
LHHLREIAIRDAVLAIPPHAYQDDLDRKSAALEDGHLLVSSTHLSPYTALVNATEPFRQRSVRQWKMVLVFWHLIPGVYCAPWWSIDESIRLEGAKIVQATVRLPVGERQLLPAALWRYWARMLARLHT